MRTANLADGRKLTFPDETTDDVMQQTVQRVLSGKMGNTSEQPANGQAPGFQGRDVEGLVGLGETALTMGSDLVGKAVAGLATPFMAAWDAVTNKEGESVLDDVSRKIGIINDFIRVDPKTERGKQSLEAVSHIMDAGIKALQGTVGAGVTLRGGGTPEQAAQTYKDVQEKGAGETVLERTGSPLLATGAEVGTDAALMLAPMIGKGMRLTPERPMRPVEAPINRPPVTDATSEFLPRGTAEPVPPTSPRTKLTFSEKDMLDALSQDFHPETTVQELASPKFRRQIRIDALKNAENVRAGLEEVLGEAPIFADLGGAATRSKSSALAAVSNTGKALAQPALKRNTQVRSQMANVLDEAIMKGKDYDTAVGFVDKRTRKNSDRLYNETYDADFSITPEITRFFLEEPVAKDAIRKAVTKVDKDTRLSREKRNDTIAMLRTALGSPARGKPILASGKPNPNYVPAKLPNPTVLDFYALDMVKRGIDEFYRTFPLNKRGGSEHSAVNTARAQFRDMFVEANPKYGEALSAWSTDMTALDAAKMGRDALTAIRSNKRSVQDVVRESDGLSPFQQELYNIGIADAMKSRMLRKPDTPNGMTPQSVFDEFGGSPAFKMLLERVLPPESLAKMDRFAAAQEVIGKTTGVLKISDAAELQARKSLSMGMLPQMVFEGGTDLLFVSQGANRFAALNLIETVFTKPRMIGEMFRAPKTAEIAIGKATKRSLQELIDILEYQQSNSLIKQMKGKIKVPERLKQAATLSDAAFMRWLSIKDNRLALYKYAGMASMVEAEALKEAGQEDN